MSFLSWNSQVIFSLEKRLDCCPKQKGPWVSFMIKCNTQVLKYSNRLTLQSTEAMNECLSWKCSGFCLCYTIFVSSANSSAKLLVISSKNCWWALYSQGSALSRKSIYWSGNEWNLIHKRCIWNGCGCWGNISDYLNSTDAVCHCRCHVKNAAC